MNTAYADVQALNLDPRNPRLGRHELAQNLSQEALLERMRDFTLEELAESYLENGAFWTHEAMLVVHEPLYGEATSRLVVVEGNRRLAALKLLKATIEGNAPSPRWKRLAANAPIPEGLFDRVPYLLLNDREQIQPYLGFRHVTGIKQWGADEKAGFIAHLIEHQGMGYEQVMRRIGSKTPTVRRHYIAYRLLLQIEDCVESFSPQLSDNRFTVLYMSISTEGVQQYLDIDDMAAPQAAITPVPRERSDRLAQFSRWLFGTEKLTPVVTDTRQVSDFGKILLSEEAIAYLERTAEPSLEVAKRIAGGDEAEIIHLVEQAADSLELALGRLHFYRGSEKLKRAIYRLGKDTQQVLSLFPKIKQLIEEEQA